MKTIEERNGEYYKPVVVEDWGALGYFLYAYKSDSGTWSIADQVDKARLLTGEIVDVLWPDEHKSQHLILESEYTRRIPDMGQTYFVRTRKLFIGTAVHGACVQVPLESLWVKKILPEQSK